MHMSNSYLSLAKGAKNSLWKAFVLTTSLSFFTTCWSQEKAQNPGSLSHFPGRLPGSRDVVCRGRPPVFQQHVERDHREDPRAGGSRLQLCTAGLARPGDPGLVQCQRHPDRHRGGPERRGHQRAADQLLPGRPDGLNRARRQLPRGAARA